MIVCGLNLKGEKQVKTVKVVLALLAIVAFISSVWVSVGQQTIPKYTFVVKVYDGHWGTHTVAEGEVGLIRPGGDLITMEMIPEHETESMFTFAIHQYIVNADRTKVESWPLGRMEIRKQGDAIIRQRVSDAIPPDIAVGQNFFVVYVVGRVGHMPSESDVLAAVNNGQQTRAILWRELKLVQEIPCLAPHCRGEE